jgi:hypothetical protein
MISLAISLRRPARPSIQYLRWTGMARMHATIVTDFTR